MYAYLLLRLVCWWRCPGRVGSLGRIMFPWLVYLIYMGPSWACRLFGIFVCVKQQLHVMVVPLAQWLPGYHKTWIMCDLYATMMELSCMVWSCN